MKITYFELEIDSTKEIELVTKYPFGFKVTVLYTKAGNFKGKTEVLNNITEVHHMYDERNKQIAFESDIHQTGGTHNISDIDSIHIEYSGEFKPKFLGILLPQAV